MIFLTIFISAIILSSIKCKSADKFPLETSSISVGDDLPINPYIFFPCFRVICDYQTGCYSPLIFNAYLISFPPLSGCPEVYRKKTIRFLVVDRNDLTHLYSASIIKPGSSVAFLVHGVFFEYDFIYFRLLLRSQIKDFQYVIFVDWSYLAAPYAIDHIPITGVSSFLAQINAILVGRVTCQYTELLAKFKKINPETIKIIAHSAGSNMLASIGDYCKSRYHLKYGHFVALELPATSYRRSNYPLTNYTHAKYVDIVLTTLNLPIPYFDVIPAINLHVGAYESDGTCTYFVNPEVILAGQPQCLSDAIPQCSHNTVLVVYAAAALGRCFYKYYQCPGYLGYSSPKTGLTRLNCKDHPHLFRTCLEVPPFPFQSC